jgi:hypothetical protein
LIVHLRLPRRPSPRNPKAKRVLEWADVIFYIFCLVLTAVVLVLAVASYGPSIGSLIRSLALLGSLI